MHPNLRTVLTRRALGAGFGLGLAALALPGAAVAQAITPAAPHVLGNPDAPVTLEEWASLTCSHCAHFHTDILPKIKADFIDTGQVKLVFHDFPFDRFALTGSMLARCMPKERYFAFIGVLFKTQRQWATAEDPMLVLGQTARLAGMTPAAYSACLADQSLKQSIAMGVKAAKDKHNIVSTPTFIINGKDRVDGAKEQEIVDALVRAGAKRATPTN